MTNSTAQCRPMWTILQYKIAQWSPPMGRSRKFLLMGSAT